MILKSDFVKVTSRQPEHPNPLWGGAKKARFCCALLLLLPAPGCALHLGPTPPEILCTSRQYDDEICVGARLSAQAVIGYDE